MFRQLDFVSLSEKVVMNLDLEELELASAYADGINDFVNKV